MSISYPRGDELPVWEATVTVNDQTVDFSSGWTFSVAGWLEGNVATPELVKSTGIVGFAESIIQVQWADGDLDLEPGVYAVQLKATRSSDNAEVTVTDDLIIRERAA